MRIFRVTIVLVLFILVKAVLDQVAKVVIPSLSGWGLVAAMLLTVSVAVSGIVAILRYGDKICSFFEKEEK